MSRFISLTRQSAFGELLPLLALGVGLAGLLGTAQAVGELLYILECSGAVGGTTTTS